MLSSTVTSVSSTSAISMTTAVGLGIGGVLLSILLIMLLSSKEMILASNKQKQKKLLKPTLNAIITPLLFAFTMIVLYKIITIL